jgi:hypothetical protein
MPFPQLNLFKRVGVFVVLALCGAANPARAADNFVAVVSSLSGSAQVISPSGEKRVLERFDRLPAGSVIEVGSGSLLKLVFSNGNRYALEAGTRATVNEGGPQASAGKVSPLDPLPSLPRLKPLANAAGTTPAATRVRGGPDRIRNLYPCAGSASLVESTVLRFSASEGATSYRIEIEDESGRSVLDAETQSAALTVPAGVLRPGAHYYWSVRTVERIGSTMRAESEFSTLPEDDTHRRSVLRSALMKAGDAESLALLAEVDWRLGLLAEAREEFRAALMKSPTDPALQRAIAEVDKELEANSD